MHSDIPPFNNDTTTTTTTTTDDDDDDDDVLNACSLPGVCSRQETHDE